MGGFHTFRHTYSTLLKANGEDVKVVQQLMRHANISITMNIYTKALTPAKREAQSRVVDVLMVTSNANGRMGLLECIRKSACPDLCGGRAVRPVPTATTLIPMRSSAGFCDAGRGTDGLGSCTPRSPKARDRGHPQLGWE
jgi:hypothetical protein